MKLTFKWTDLHDDNVDTNSINDIMSFVKSSSVYQSNLSTFNDDHDIYFQLQFYYDSFDVTLY